MNAGGRANTNVLQYNKVLVSVEREGRFAKADGESNMIESRADTIGEYEELQHLILCVCYFQEMKHSSWTDYF